jgi:hypothetical protein
MPAKKYSVEQIIAKLREHEKPQSQGLTVVQACKPWGRHLSDRLLHQESDVQTLDMGSILIFDIGRRPPASSRPGPTREDHSKMRRGAAWHVL